MTEIAVTYVFLFLIAKYPPRYAVPLGGAIIVLQLLVLIYYKYSGFILNDVFRRDVVMEVRRIPPGISFYTFQMVAFVVETVRHQKAMPKPLDFLNFVSFFPQIVAGPIERREQLLPQIQRFRFIPSLENCAAGAPIVVLGLFYKLVIADNLALFFDPAAETNAYLIWFTTLIFGLRIYFDFAGYSLIALGIGRVFGVWLTVNFLAPYSASNIQDFWRRWHVTLSRWFRDYVYIPLGGGRTGFWGLNILIVFALSGIWHGAGFNFLIWGVWHGLLLIGHRYLSQHARLPEWLAWCVTASLVTISWLFFYETRGSALRHKVVALLSPAGYSSGNLASAIAVFDAGSLAALLATFILAGFALLMEFRSRRDPMPYQPLLRIRFAIFFAMAILLFAPSESNEFIYFAF